MIDGIPVIDGVVHPYNLDADNEAQPAAAVIREIVYESVIRAARPGYVVGREDFFVDWSVEEMANLLFLESDIDLAVNHVLPVYAFRDGLCSLEKAIEAQQRWPDRFVTYCGVDPMLGEAAMEELERQVEPVAPVGLKLYPNM